MCILLIAGIGLAMLDGDCLAAQPVITGVLIPDLSMKINDVVTVTISVQSDSATVYTLNASDIGGYTLDFLTKQDGTAYTAILTITEGGTGFTGGDDIPVNVTLADGEQTDNWIAPICQMNDPIDASRPIDPTPSSTSHTASEWDDDDTVDIAISGASDLGGSGVDGFEYEWDQNVSWTPSETKEVEETWTGGTLTATSNGDWYFHIATVDNVGNWTSTEHLGPFRIDTIPPSVPANLAPVDGSYTTDTSPKLSWDASADEIGGSGIRDDDAYRYVVEGTLNRSDYTTNTTYTPSLEEGVYVWRVRARDNAGNNSAYTSETTLIIDTTQPDVTIEQAGAQVDPTNVSLVTFTVVFDEPIDVATFTNADVTINGTATTGAIAVTEIAPNDGTTFTVTVVVTSDGTVIASIPAGGIADFVNHANTASTSIDNAVTFDTSSPNVMTVATSRSQIADADVGVSAFTATVVFNETMDVGVAPTLVFNPAVTDGETPTVSNPFGVWSASLAVNDTYTMTYDVVDRNIDIDSVSIDVSGGQDLAGNGQLDYTPAHAFDIDMVNPSVTAVAADTNPLYDGNLVQRVTITFNETMDTVTNPAIAFDAGTFTATSDGAWSVTNTVWTESFTLADDNQDATAVTIDIIGAKDAAGNAQHPCVVADEFDIDAQNPIVSSLQISDLRIDDLDIGWTFTVTVDFSEGMDGGSDPAIIFTPAIDTTLSLTSDYWLDANTFEAIYDVADANRVELGIDISVSGSRDLTGNVQVVYDAIDQFDIETLNSPPGTMPNIAITPMGTAGAGTFLDRYLELGEGEEPSMAGLRPLTAIYGAGETVTGACNILNPSGNTARGSYIRVFIYAVNIEVRPEALILLDHWVARYDRDRGGYSFSWDTAEYAPGYYDVYLSLAGASSHTCRIQLIEPSE